MTMIDHAWKKIWKMRALKLIPLTLPLAALLVAPHRTTAFPTGAPAGYANAPTSAIDFGNCTACHSPHTGPALTTGMSISGFGAGNTYTPGAVEHLTVTLPASSSNHGFEFTARLATSTTTSEGTLASTDATTQVLSGGIFITHTSAGNSTNAYHFDWTPPATNVGNIAFYAAGVNGGPNVFTTTVTLTATGGGTLPTISVTPPSLSFAYQTGAATPPAQTLSVSSSGAAVTFTAAVVGATWLSVAPASGTTPGSVSVSINPTGLAAGTYSGSVSIASS